MEPKGPRRRRTGASAPMTFTPETDDAEAGYMLNVLLEPLNTPLGAGLHVVCAQGSNGARVEPLLTVSNILPHQNLPKAIDWSIWGEQGELFGSCL